MSSANAQNAAARRRADLVLVGAGLFETRAQAQAAIAAGRVRVGGEVVRRSSQSIDPSAAIEAEAAHPFASRGGLKLDAALRNFAIDVSGLEALDVGASTGGFTDVLLRHGATRVTAVDVGHGQMRPALVADPRVRLIEGTDARSLTAAMLPAPPGIVTVDVSFISLAKVLPFVLPLAAPGARLVALVKPQFEVGRAGLGKGGIVRDSLAREAALADICACIESLGWTIEGTMDSPVEGGDGNHEFLVTARASA